MIHLLEQATGQSIVLTLHEYAKDSRVIPSDHNGVALRFTNELTKQIFYTSVKLTERDAGCLDVIQKNRYWKIPDLDTTGGQSITNGGIQITQGGYFSYICYLVKEYEEYVPDFSLTNQFHFVERGLCLIGEAQHYFNEYDQEIPQSIAYPGKAV